MTRKFKDYVVFLQDQGIEVYNCISDLVPLIYECDNDVIMLAIEDHNHEKKIEKLIKKYGKKDKELILDYFEKVFSKITENELNCKKGKKQVSGREGPRPQAIRRLKNFLFPLFIFPLFIHLFTYYISSIYFPYLITISIYS